MDVTLTNEIPAPTRTVSNPLAHIVAKMEIGDSFALPYNKRQSVWYAHWWHRKKPENSHKRFVSKVVMENGERMCRCWRIEDGEPTKSTKFVPAAPPGIKSKWDQFRD